MAALSCLDVVEGHLLPWAPFLRPPFGWESGFSPFSPAGRQSFDLPKMYSDDVSERFGGSVASAGYVPDACLFQFCRRRFDIPLNFFGAPFSVVWNVAYVLCGVCNDKRKNNVIFKTPD